MNSVIKFFNFRFLWKLDIYILLNHTLIWNFRLPYILFYGFIINIALFFYLFFYDFKIYQIAHVYHNCIDFFFILVLFIFGDWLYQQKNYIPLDKYNKLRMSFFQEYLLHFISIFIILLPFFTINIVTKFKIDTLKKYNAPLIDKNIYYDRNITKEIVFLYTNIVVENSEITFDIKNKVESSYKIIHNWKKSLEALYP